MYIHNSFEQQSHFTNELELLDGDGQSYMDKLARAFEFYEAKREAGDI